MGNLRKPSQPRRFRRDEYCDLCRPILCGKPPIAPSETHVDVDQIRGVESELSSNLAEDDIERELMRSPSTSLLFSPSRDQNDQVVTPVRYQG